MKSRHNCCSVYSFSDLDNMIKKNTEFKLKNNAKKVCNLHTHTRKVKVPFDGLLSPDVFSLLDSVSDPPLLFDGSL